MFELIYTSSPQGLLPGTRGFSTVAFTAGMPPNLIMPLENLSGYNFTFQDGTLPDEFNPPCFRYIKMRFGNQLLRVASRIAPNGLDYSKRNNKIAHHWLFESAAEAAQFAESAAELLNRSDCFALDFQDSPRELPFRRIPAAFPTPLPAQTFQQLAGDSGWAGWIAEQFRAAPTQPVYIKYSSRTDPQLLLNLIGEVCALLDDDEIADFTFSTYFAPAGNSVECFLQMMPDFSPLLNNIERFHADKLLVLDGQQILPDEYNSLPACIAARSGKFPVQEVSTPSEDQEEETDYTQLPLPPPNIRIKPVEQRKIPVPPIPREMPEEKTPTKADAHKKFRAAFLVIAAVIMIVSLILLCLPQQKAAEKPKAKPVETKVLPAAPTVPAPEKKIITPQPKVQTLPAPRQQVQPKPTPEKQLSLRDASTRNLALPTDHQSGLRFYIEIKKAAQSSLNEYTMPLPEKLQHPDEIFVVLRTKNQDKYPFDSNSFIRSAERGGVVIRDATTRTPRYTPLPMDKYSPELVIVPTPDGKALQFTRTVDWAKSIIPKVENIEKIYFRIGKSIFIADRSFRNDYLQYIPAGKLELGLNGVFTYQPSSLEKELTDVVEPCIGNTSMITFLSSPLPISNWNKTVPVYCRTLDDFNRLDNSLKKYLRPDAQPLTREELKEREEELKNNIRGKDIEKIIPQVTAILDNFFSDKLLSSRTATDKDIKNMLEKVKEKLKDYSEDKKSELAKVYEAAKLWNAKCRKISELRSDLQKRKETRKNLNDQTKEIESLYSRMIKPVKSAGLAEDQIKALLKDSKTGRPLIFTDKTVSAIIPTLQQQIKIVLHPDISNLQAN